MPYGNATAPRRVPCRVDRFHRFKMAPNQTIYEGSLCTFNADGLVVYGTVGANLMFAGVALETKTAAAGETPLIAIATAGVFNFTKSSASQSDVGKEAYLDSGASGNPQQVTLTDPGANDLIVGCVVGAPTSSSLDVDITGYALLRKCAAT